MAKISARGATEVARLVRDHHTYVFTSDGRVLTQTTYSDGKRSGYNIVARNVKGNRMQSYIDGLCRNAGYRPAR